MKRTLISLIILAGTLVLNTANASAAPPAQPAGDVVSVLTDGCQLYWPSPYEVCGPIRDLYNTLGGATSSLGWPKSAETTDPDGIGKRSEFTGGAIHWTPDTGAYVV
ncbi:LGFP repeat-containing protein [Rhodococcus erythropolis]|uniref:LGFP repeat-containing protein n=1 Tax=Rhodococcus erythropolis TaxID=1833 RepID=UPI0040438BF6